MSNKNLETIRHSLSHLMAMAVLEIIPEAKLTIGPAIDNGFYYDFDLPKSLTPDDLTTIGKKMKQLISANLSFDQYNQPVDQARQFYQDQKNDYKIELIDELAKKGEKEVSFYKSDDFIDLCAGPHIKSTAEIDPESFKVDKIAGAYWRGDEKNKMLQRVYGLAFESKEKLEEYLANREEAEKRDHRKLGKDLNLFHIDDKVGLGLVLWHPKGARLWRTMEDHWFSEHEKAGYSLVKTPHIGNQKLWELSGHWNFYSSSMYPPLEAGQTLEEAQAGKKIEISEKYLLKPMNCPFHLQIYNSSLHSYRELPLRWAEPGTVYRFEKTGELSGLTRVRGFTQDDAHIICREDQVEDELKRVIDFIYAIYASYGFQSDKVITYLSLRDPDNKEKYSGNDEGWRFTESILRQVASEKKLKFTEEKGEAAFYGPKLDFKIQDIIGRKWQCATLQFDFNLPNRFEMKFINSKGQEEKPYVLHRTLLGSFERFIGLLIEHYAGAFPLWLAPVQVIILPIADRHLERAKEISQELVKEEIRVEIDGSTETINKKIRNAELVKIPAIWIIGDKEVESGQISQRPRKDYTSSLADGSIDVELAIENIKKLISDKK